MFCVFEPLRVLLLLYCMYVCMYIGMLYLLSLPLIYAAYLYAHLDRIFLTVITSYST